LIYVVGIRFFMYLRYTQNVPFSGTVLATLITCLAMIVAAAEAFYRLVERPSKLLAYWSYEWITT
jgi:peptidoglycan/LPS O-acetylase OafA/YrhL